MEYLYTMTEIVIMYNNMGVDKWNPETNKNPEYARIVEGYLDSPSKCCNKLGISDDYHLDIDKMFDIHKPENRNIRIKKTEYPNNYFSCNPIGFIPYLYSLSRDSIKKCQKIDFLIGCEMCEFDYKNNYKSQFENHIAQYYVRKNEIDQKVTTLYREYMGDEGKYTKEIEPLLEKIEKFEKMYVDNLDKLYLEIANSNPDIKKEKGKYGHVCEIERWHINKYRIKKSKLSNLDLIINNIIDLLDYIKEIAYRGKVTAEDNSFLKEQLASLNKKMKNKIEFEGEPSKSLATIKSELLNRLNKYVTFDKNTSDILDKIQEFKKNYLNSVYTEIVVEFSKLGTNKCVGYDTNRYNDDIFVKCAKDEIVNIKTRFPTVIDDSKKLFFIGSHKYSLKPVINDPFTEEEIKLGCSTDFIKIDKNINKYTIDILDYQCHNSDNNWTTKDKVDLLSQIQVSETTIKGQKLLILNVHNRSKYMKFQFFKNYITIFIPFLNQLIKTTKINNYIIVGDFNTHHLLDLENELVKIKVHDHTFIRHSLEQIYAQYGNCADQDPRGKNINLGLFYCLNDFILYDIEKISCNLITFTSSHYPFIIKLRSVSGPNERYSIMKSKLELLKTIMDIGQIEKDFRQANLEDSISLDKINDIMIIKKNIFIQNYLLNQENRDKFNQKLDDLQKTVMKQEEKINEYSQEINDLQKSKEIQLKEKIEDYEKRIQNQEEKLKKMQEELNELRIKTEDNKKKKDLMENLLKELSYQVKKN